jgi:hypothetical protein
VFSQPKFGLPACTTANGCFTKIYASGTQPPIGDTLWVMETSLDVEWAHAIAPQAKIFLIEAASNTGDLYTGVEVAIQHHPSVISLSWGSGEFSSEISLDSIFQNSAAPVVASSGDAGEGVLYPAASPYVLSVGGTTLNVDSNGNYLSETAWSGSGGGISVYESEPAYQTGLPVPLNGRGRGVPDVAYNANPATGYSIYDSTGGGWVQVGGTSASAPQWAALIAVANSARTTNLTNFNTAIYNAASPSSYGTLFHDVTLGQNGTCGYYCGAQPGYDYVTGLGSPQAANLIPYFGNNISCVAGNPTLSISPGTQSISPSGTVNFTLSLRDTDSSSCPAASFPLYVNTINSAGSQVGFSNVLSISKPTLSPGQSVTSNLQVTAPAGLASGAYTVWVSATNSVSQRGTLVSAGLTNNSSTTCVRGSPALSISPSTQSIASSGSVNFTVSLQNTDSGSCPATSFPLNVNTMNSAGSQVGFTSTLSPSNPTLSPGQSATSTLKVTAPAGLPSGVYTSWVSVANAASQLGSLASAQLTH